MQVTRAANPGRPPHAKVLAAPIPGETDAETASTSRPAAPHAAKAADLPEWKASRNAWQADRGTMSSAEWFAARTAWMEQRDVALGKTAAAPEPPIDEVVAPESLEESELASEPVDHMPDFSGLEPDEQLLPGEGEA